MSEVACPDSEIAFFNGEHAKPNGLANELQPQYANVEVLPGGCLQAMKRFINRREGIDLTDNSPSCAELGRCAVVALRSGG